MTVMDAGATYRIRMDGKHRPTPLVMLDAFQLAVAEGKSAQGMTHSLVDSLLADRSADPSARA